MTPQWPQAHPERVRAAPRDALYRGSWAGACWLAPTVSCPDLIPSSPVRSPSLVEDTFDRVAVVPTLLDEPIDTETTRTGTPITLHWRKGRLPVRQVCAIWQAPGQGRLYRVGVTTPGGQPAIAEITERAGGWRLRYLWT